MQNPRTQFHSQILLLVIWPRGLAITLVHSVAFKHYSQVQESIMIFDDMLHDQQNFQSCSPTFVIKVSRLKEIEYWWQLFLSTISTLSQVIHIINGLQSTLILDSLFLHWQMSQKSSLERESSWEVAGNGRVTSIKCLLLLISCLIFVQITQLTTQSTGTPICPIQSSKNCKIS